MTILSAHFAFSPSQGLIKFPHLRLDGNGLVADITGCGNNFVEVHSAQFFNGLLMPGLVADLRNEKKTNDQPTALIRKIHDYYLWGTQYFIVPGTTPVSILESMPAGPTIIFNDELPALPIISGSPWEFIKQRTAEANGQFIDVLNAFYSSHWSLVKNHIPGGDFLAGLKPGVFVVSGIDWQTGILSPKATVRPLA
jgi:hypothetical protein